MSNEELAGRVCALEVLAMTALGLYLANSRNDPDYQKAAGVIEHIRISIAENAKELPLAARTHAAGYGNRLLEVVSQNLRALRGEGGQPN